MKTELLLLHIKLFKKLKRSLKLVSQPHFLHIFLKKSISIMIFYWLTKFHCLVAFTSWDIGQYMYCNCLLTRLWRHKFWNQIYLSNKVTFSIWPKNSNKNSNKIIKSNKGYLSSSKGFHWSKWSNFFLEGQSRTLSFILEE